VVRQAVGIASQGLREIDETIDAVFVDLPYNPIRECGHLIRPQQVVVFGNAVLWFYETELARENEESEIQAAGGCINPSDALTIVSADRRNCARIATLRL